MSDQQILPDSGFDYGELDAIARKAVADAREESRRLGVPNVSGKDGVWWYELPSGEWTTQRPEIFSEVPGLPEAPSTPAH